MTASSEWMPPLMRTLGRESTVSVCTLLCLGLMTLIPLRSWAQDANPLSAGSAENHQRHADSTTADQPAHWERRALVLGGALVFDERIRAAVQANRAPVLDRLAVGADILGTAEHIVPALVATYAAAIVLERHPLADATLRIGASYAAADAVEALLKPAIGRIRPYVGREPLTFRPFTANDDFHSLPSAHVVHVASLGTALAMETDNTWFKLGASVAAAYVGAQRVYRDQHWASDVVLSDILGDEIARATMHWLHHRP